MRTLIAFMLFTMTPVAAGDFEDGAGYYNAGDYQKTFRLHRPLAEQGHALAQFSLGMMYEMGEGVPKDDAKAVYWYRKAAERGYARAQSDLRNMYYRGEGILEDYVQAYAWWNIAATRGDRVAKKE